jgi:hypothetical protein
LNITNIITGPTFDPVQSDLISSGNLRLISNERLKKILSNWSSDIIALKELEAMWSNKTYTQFEPLIYKLGIGRDVSNSWMNEAEHLFFLDDNSIDYKSNIGNSKHNISVEEITDSKELEGIVSDAISYNTGANVQSKALIKRIEEILDLIEIELTNGH